MDERQSGVAGNPPRLAGAALIAVGLAIGGALLWRRRRPSVARAVPLRDAWMRAAARPRLVTRKQPGVGAKIFGSAAAAVASVLAKRLAQRWLESTPVGHRLDRSVGA
jgi:hypothetical protein